MRLGSRFLAFVLSISQSAATQHIQAYDGGVRHHADQIRSPIRSADYSNQRIIQVEEDHKAADHSHQLDTLTDLQESLHILQSTWYDLEKGTWPSSIDWTGAVLNTHLVATLSTISRAKLAKQQHELDNLINHYFAQTAAYYYGENAASLRQQAYDDMLWVVLSWLESIKLIKAHSSDGVWYANQFMSVFARRAWSFYNVTSNGWSDDLCNGGMTWNPSLAPYKNAITNELFIAASVGMYLHFPEPHNTSFHFVSKQRYLDVAIDGYSWLARSNMTNRQGLFVDGFHISDWNKNGTGGTACNIRNEMVYTYNQGVVLSGLRGLWEATGNATYLYDGLRIVRSTIAATGWSLKRAQPSNDTSWRGLGRAGVMEDYCDASGTCGQDAHTFKSIYFHHLALFCEPLPAKIVSPGLTFEVSARLLKSHRTSCTAYARWVAHNAQAALATRDKKGRIGAWWNAGRNFSESARLPARAVDYRNTTPKDTRWTKRIDTGREVDSRRTKSRSDTKKRRSTATQMTIHRDDPNERGRGRTVESHSGGVAVLRCLYRMPAAG